MIYLVKSADITVLNWIIKTQSVLPFYLMIIVSSTRGLCVLFLRDSVMEITFLLILMTNYLLLSLLVDLYTGRVYSITTATTRCMHTAWRFTAASSRSMNRGCRALCSSLTRLLGVNVPSWLKNVGPWAGQRLWTRPGAHHTTLSPVTAELSLVLQLKQRRGWMCRAEPAAERQKVTAASHPETASPCK